MTRSLLALIVTFSLAAASWAADASTMDMAAMTKAMADAATPGPEHKKLEPLAGNWTYTCKMWMDPSQPAMESTGTIERTWTLGNRFLEEKVTGTMPDGTTPFEGRGVIGYDNLQKKYTMGWICSMGTAISKADGTVDASGKVFTFDHEEFCPIRKQKIQMRDEVRIESNDKHVIETFEVDNGKQTKMMEIVATRQK